MKELIKESRADHIIQSARQVFFARGFSKTAISEICKVAGCSRTTLYSYFESKENLYLAVVKKTFIKFLAHFSPLELDGKTGLDRVLSLAIGYLDFAQQYPQHYQLILDFYGILRSINEETVQTETHLKIKECIYFEGARDLAQLPLKVLTEEIQKGQTDGSIHTNASPAEHLMNIWAYLKGISDVSPIMNKLTFKEKEEMDMARSVTRIIRAIFKE